MFKLSKKVEYGLIALRHLAILPQGQSATAREIAEEYQIPAELCAKTLSLLSRAGLALSTEGVRGGYTLGREPQEISVHAVVQAIEGDPSLTECMDGTNCGCTMHSVCMIRDPLRRLQENITQAFSQMTLAEMIWPVRTTDIDVVNFTAPDPI